LEQTKRSLQGYLSRSRSINFNQIRSTTWMFLPAPPVFVLYFSCPYSLFYVNSSVSWARTVCQ